MQHEPASEFFKKYGITNNFLPLLLQKYKGTLIHNCTIYINNYGLSIFPLIKSY